MALFDAMERSCALSGQLERPGARRLVRIGAAGAFDNALTIYVPGCNLACVHCWAGPEREDPIGCSRWWTFDELRQHIRHHRQHSRLPAAAHRLRISGGEAVLSLGVLDLIDALLRLPGRLSLETNGVMLGVQPEIIKGLLSFGGRLHLNLSIKAGTIDQFERITGAKAEAWEAAWAGLDALRRSGMDFELNALSLASELFSQTERGAMLERLDSMDASLRQRLSEERLTGYPDTLRRMAKGLVKEG